MPDSSNQGPEGPAGPLAPRPPLTERWGLSAPLAPDACLRRLSALGLEVAFHETRSLLAYLSMSADILRSAFEVFDRHVTRLERRLRSGQPEEPEPEPRDADFGPVLDGLARSIDRLAALLGPLETVVEGEDAGPVDAVEAMSLAVAITYQSTQYVGGVRWQPPLASLWLKAPRLVVVAALALALRAFVEASGAGPTALVDGDVRAAFRLDKGGVSIELCASFPDPDVVAQAAQALRLLLEPWSPLTARFEGQTLVLSAPAAVSPRADAPG